MSHFIRNGNTFRVADDEAMDLHKRLPAGNYIIKQDMFGAMFLEHIDSFEPIGRVYGDCLKNTDRILNTFMSRKGKSTGVMLTGEKGSGKTLLARTLSITAAKNWAIPTIIINSAWTGDAFNKLIQDIDQPCIVLFDEFEKVYDEDEQEAILTLMDGVFPTEKLFVLTCNDKWRVDKHMRNRPGRIFYMIDFKGLDAAFIREYCDDNLQADYQIHTDKICTLASLFSEFNFDMLKALVEEINRYGDTPQEALRILNVKPEFDGGARYELTMFVGGKEVICTHPGEFEGNPMQLERERFYWTFKKEDRAAQRQVRQNKVLGGIELDDDEEDHPEREVYFDSADLIQILPATGTFEFVNKKGHRLIMKRAKTTYYHFDAF
jgi:hypothetical protein